MVKDLYRRRSTDAKRHKIAAYSLTGLSLLAVVFITLCLNLIYFEHHQLYQPNERLTTSPQDIGIFYESVDFETEDGQSLNGWFIPVPGAKTTVLFCHGRAGNLSDELAKIKFFHDMGMNLMMFDYRGYGRSSGTPSEKGFYKDTRAAYDFLISRNDVDKEKIVVIGESLGGAVAADLCLHRKVKALVLESSIVSVLMEARRLYPFLPTDFLPLEKFDTLSKIKKIQIPKLFVHGLDDEDVSFSDALQLYYASSGPKKFLPFQGTHDDDIFKISQIYKDELRKFLHENNLL